MSTETTTKTDTCVKCTHWNPLSENKGECRRQPPQAITFRVDNETKMETRFPVTSASDWCGEFKAK